MDSDIDYSKPFRVRVTMDCREGAKVKLDGQYGFCLGLYEYPDKERRMPEGASNEELDYNPLILTDNGHYIWGIECYWTGDPTGMDMPLDILRDAAKLQAFLFGKAASARDN